MGLRRSLTLAVLLTTALAAGCGALTTTKHCDLREVEDAHCQEYQLYGPDILAMRGTCEAVGGTWGDDACPDGEILGGCEDQDPSNPWEVTKRYYAGFDEDITSEADVEQECDDEVEVFVPAP